LPDRPRIDTGVDRPAPIHIHVNDHITPCYPGETVATALLAAGVVIFRRTAGGAARAPVCNMGVCFDCLVTIDGRPSVRSCMTRVAEHMRVEVPRHD
jgi:predicted molibdopterin-dependent oxidoreductase YjgC